MPRKLPPPHPKGAPRTPGSGRKKGTPNSKTVEMRALLAALCNDVDYQPKLREDFIKRRVHPSTEALAWAHVFGKPKEQIEMSREGVDRREARGRARDASHTECSRT
jgi:hypothetical protein